MLHLSLRHRSPYNFPKVSEQADRNGVMRMVTPGGIKPASETLRVREPGRSLRSPSPSMLKPSLSSQASVAPLAHDKTRSTLHSQKDSDRPPHNRSQLRISRNSLSETGTAEAGTGRYSGRSGGPSCEPAVYHTPSSPFPPSSRCDIFTIRWGGGPHRDDRTTPWQASVRGMVFGANGDSSDRSG